MCGFNKMVPQRTLQTSQWPLFETCFPGTSFPVSETCRGPLALPIFQRVIFFFVSIWNRVFTLHKPRTLNDLKEAIRQEIRPIGRQLLARAMEDFKRRKGLKTTSKKTVVILPISFLKLNHPVWHVLSFNFV